jgi:hypothetical protein
MEVASSWGSNAKVESARACGDLAERLARGDFAPEGISDRGLLRLKPFEEISFEGAKGEVLFADLGRGPDAGGSEVLGLLDSAWKAGREFGWPIRVSAHLTVPGGKAPVRVWSVLATDPKDLDGWRMTGASAGRVRPVVIQGLAGLRNAQLAMKVVLGWCRALGVKRVNARKEANSGFARLAAERKGSGGRGCKVGGGGGVSDPSDVRRKHRATVRTRGTAGAAPRPMRAGRYRSQWLPEKSGRAAA